MNAQEMAYKVLREKCAYALHLEEMLYRNPDMTLTKEQAETITWFRNEVDIMAHNLTTDAKKE